MPKPCEELYLAARIPDASELVNIYNSYRSSPECFAAGVQYALDKILSRMKYEDDFFEKHHLHAVDILTQVKEGRLL